MKAGLPLNLKKTKVLSTQDTREFKVDDEDVEVAEKLFLGSLMIAPKKLEALCYWLSQKQLCRSCGLVQKS